MPLIFEMLIAFHRINVRISLIICIRWKITNRIIWEWQVFPSTDLKAQIMLPHICWNLQKEVEETEDDYWKTIRIPIEICRSTNSSCVRYFVKKYNNLKLTWNWKLRKQKRMRMLIAFEKRDEKSCWSQLKRSLLEPVSLPYYTVETLNIWPKYINITQVNGENMIKEPFFNMRVSGLGPCHK